jgi:hypothetical protein
MSQRSDANHVASLFVVSVRRSLLMNHLRDGLIAGLSLASLIVCTPGALAATLSAADADGTPQLLTELQFDSTAAMTTPKTSASIPTSAMNLSGWTIGAQVGGSIGIQPTPPPEATASTVDALEGIYPDPPSAGQYIWADYSVAALNTEDIYIEFWAKMPSQYKGGCKFVKVFGERATIAGAESNADVTIYTDYTGVDFGAIREIVFGDGTSLRNDSQNAILLSGANPTFVGRSYGTAVVKTPQMSDFPSSAWGTGWHHFRMHIKFNSGTTSQNEVPNGEYYLEIDGKVYVDATSLYNRNPANGPINYIEFFGWAQKDPEPFTLWYDDIRISTGGFVSTPLPDPPSDVGAN